ncbi:8-amino-7-oxononanoate synthase [Methylovorus glucosotrophus]|uniref:8-amino-7-oxononanoate synthase n=1 Tax=Methylovorus glucosotrophus (strain SIP3-4) TaxID=582744 RepID=C6X9J3_METGS|nr:8-amino-7-oxononanoate synthase [Methylovorus glucosotrophus]ACT49813.1 8-amino-7-oxononanoate synthase [Methylovorus glucosotrophus SIP3-4]
MTLLDELAAELAERTSAGLRRQRRVIQGPQAAEVVANGKRLLSFASNDYLGLANHPRLISAMQQATQAVGVGSGASHLITGHHVLHEELEQALARFVGLPAALLFSTGYMANMGVVAALMGRDDAVFADKLNHASLNDAVVLSRAEFKRYPHQDLAALESLLAASRARRKLVLVDAVFSMDGDIAPVPEILALCERYDAWLMLDDAHGFGVLGEHGAGILEHFNITSPRIIYMATLGKAAGVAGAFVAGEPVLIDYLLQQARTYIYTTASPAPLAAALLEALNVIRDEPQRRAHLRQLMSVLKTHTPRRWQWMPSATAIQPLLVGSNDEVLRLSEYLLTRGLLVPAIRPPTVPKGTARLRVSLSAAHSEQDVHTLINALREAEVVLESAA